MLLLSGGGQGTIIEFDQPFFYIDAKVPERHVVAAIGKSDLLIVGIENDVVAEQEVLFFLVVATYLEVVDVEINIGNGDWLPVGLSCIVEGELTILYAEVTYFKKRECFVDGVVYLSDLRGEGTMLFLCGV